MKEKTLMKGNEALAEAALLAGCRFYFAYPITPQNEIPAYMAKRMPEVGGTFIQAESEIAAINMVMGASAGGKRTMTSSSSPGISLKQEGISYLAGNELPSVIVNIMRGGPGLGNIAGSQADYFQSTRGGGHGDYRNIVLAPGNVQEMADLTVLAFELADKYRMVVMIHGDGYMGQMSEPVVLPDPVTEFPEKPWAVTGAKGRKPQYLASLILNPEDGLELHNIHLEKHYKKVASEVQMYEEHLTEDADYLMVAYGTSARIARKAITDLRLKGIKAGLFRPISLWPFPYSQLREAAQGKKKLLTIEMSMGQMLEDVQLACGESIDVDFYGRLGGALPSEEEIIQRIQTYEQH